MSNPNGRFGVHGGQYVPETLMNAIIELEEAYNYYKSNPDFQNELTQLLNDYAGRPSRLYYAEKMTKDLGGAKIYLKREDLNHTGAHKINNVLGQALLAKKMGKTRLIAETGAGQHGVATATAAALMGMECVVFMGKEDTIRQALNVYRMRLLGATVVPVTSGTATLKDAVSEAMREWTTRISDTHYCLGSVMGPHPFPTIVREFQKVIGEEARRQFAEFEGGLPDAVIACVGGGSNAIGQDLWARIWAGARTSLTIAFFVALIEAVVGITVGVLWGYVRQLDFFFTELYNICDNVPSTIILILISYVASPSVKTLILGMSITGWIAMARFIRNQILIIRDRDYNVASRCIGTPIRRIVLRNLLPYLVSVIMLRMALTIPAAIGSEVFITYIGLGLSVEVPSLGNLINDGRKEMMQAGLRYQLLYPTIILSFVTIAFYLIGNAFSDAADPKNHLQ